MRNTHTDRFLSCLIGSCLVFLFSACGPLTPQASIPLATTTTGGSGTQTTNPTPENTSAPVSITTTNCPAAGTAQAAVMPALTLGSDQNIVYFANEGTSNAPTSGILKRYDVTTGHSTEIVKLAQTVISEAQVSADGQWLLFVAITAAGLKLQLVRMDGQYMQTLYCSPLPSGGATPASGLRDVQWSTNQKLVVFDSFTHDMSPVYLLNIQSGRVEVLFMAESGTAFLYPPRTWLDNTRVYLLGPMVDAPSGALYILDTSKGVHQTKDTLQQVLDASLIQFCWDFDSNFSGSQLFTSQCTTAPGTNGPGISGQHGPSKITVQPAIGGEQHTIFTSANMALTTIRVISKTSMLLLVENTVGDTKLNGLWKLDITSSNLTHLVTEGMGVVSYLNQDTQYPWSNASRDGSMYSLWKIQNLAGQPASYALFFGSLHGGTPTMFDSASDGTQLSIVGWTTFS